MLTEERHPEVTGHTITVPEAIEAGRIVLGDLLKRSEMPTPIDRAQVQQLLGEGAQLVEVSQ